MFKVVDEPVYALDDSNHDLPQVHALNLLLVIFKEASVAPNCQQYLGEATIKAIQGFSSEHWAIRNSSTQLFGEVLRDK